MMREKDVAQRIVIGIFSELPNLWPNVEYASGFAKKFEEKCHALSCFCCNSAPQPVLRTLTKIAVVASDIGSSAGSRRQVET